jgi:hypothetical protein
MYILLLLCKWVWRNEKFRGGGYLAQKSAFALTLFKGFFFWSALYTHFAYNALTYFISMPAYDVTVSFFCVAARVLLRWVDVFNLTLPQSILVLRAT